MLRALVAERLGTKADLEKVVGELVAAQNDDGGWSQVKELPSDALGTGQALVALASAGKTVRDPTVERAWRYLLESQKKDGSWLVKTRQVRNGKPQPNTRAASYMGTAWASIGWMRTFPAAAADDLSPRTLAALVEKATGALDLYGTPTSDTDLQLLKKRTTLHSLNLGHTKITDAGLTTLADLPELRSLDLSRNALTDAGLKTLTALKNLEALDLSFNPALTENGVEHLASLAQLHELNLEGTAVGDALLERLGEFKQLKTLQLRGTKVTAARIKTLKETRPDLQIIR
jgi:hypothetical protein